MSRRPRACVTQPVAPVWREPQAEDVHLGNALQLISLLTGVIGIVMALLPAPALRPFGIRLDPAGAFGARLFGAANIGLATALWDGQGQGFDPVVVAGLGNAVFYYCVVQGVVIVGAVIRRIANPWALCLAVLDAACIALIWSQGWPG